MDCGKHTIKVNGKNMNIFRGRYDADACRELAERYQGGDSSLIDKLLKHTSPYVGIIVRTDFKNTSEVSVDELCSDSLTAIYVMYRKGIVPTSNAAVFTGYLKTIIRRSCFKTIFDAIPREFEYGDVCGKIMHSRLPCHEDVEAKIQWDQTREHVMSLFEHDCRFVGNEFDACRYMARCLLGELPRNPLTAKRRFRLSADMTNNLLHHTKVLLYSSLYMVKLLDGF